MRKKKPLRLSYQITWERLLHNLLKDQWIKWGRIWYRVEDLWIETCDGRAQLALLLVDRDEIEYGFQLDPTELVELSKGEPDEEDNEG